MQNNERSIFMKAALKSKNLVSNSDFEEIQGKIDQNSQNNKERYCSVTLQCTTLRTYLCPVNYHPCVFCLNASTHVDTSTYVILAMFDGVLCVKVMMMMTTHDHGHNGRVCTLACFAELNSFRLKSMINLARVIKWERSPVPAPMQ